jgi:hypothetical protein
LLKVVEILFYSIAHEHWFVLFLLVLVVIRKTRLNRVQVFQPFYLAMTTVAIGTFNTEVQRSFLATDAFSISSKIVIRKIFVH